MSIQAEIEICLQPICPVYLQVSNDSSKHARGTAESHFKVVIVSTVFEQMALIERHRHVYACLDDIMQRIHALQIHTFTPDEWHERQQKAPPSSVCSSGSK